MNNLDNRRAGDLFMFEGERYTVESVDRAVGNTVVLECDKGTITVTIAKREDANE